MPVRKSNSIKKSTTTKSTSTTTNKSAKSQTSSTKKSPTTSKSTVVQVKNPKSGKYVKIDKDKGRIVSHKKSDGPYKNVPIQKSKTEGAK